MSTSTVYPTPFQPGLYRLAFPIDNPAAARGKYNPPWSQKVLPQGMLVRLVIDDSRDVPDAYKSVDEHAVAFVACTPKENSTYPDRLTLGWIVKGRWVPRGSAQDTPGRALVGAVLGALEATDDSTLSPRELLADLESEPGEAIDALLVHGDRVLMNRLATIRVGIELESDVRGAIDLRGVLRECLTLERAEQDRLNEIEAQRIAEERDREFQGMLVQYERTRWTMVKASEFSAARTGAWRMWDLSETHAADMIGDPAQGTERAKSVHMYTHNGKPVGLEREVKVGDGAMIHQYLALHGADLKEPAKVLPDETPAELANGTPVEEPGRRRGGRRGDRKPPTNRAST